jgi:hypothetical protein
VLVCLPAPGHSSVLLEGTSDKLVLQTNEAPLREVIEALGRKFHVHLKGGPNPEINVNGHFAGSLSFVVRRLLQEYDFVLAVRDDGGAEIIDITLLGHSAGLGSSPANSWAPDPQLLPTRNDGFK